MIVFKKILFLIILISPGFLLCTEKESTATVKKSVIAGKWYSSDPAELSEQIDSLLRDAFAEKSCNSPLFVVVPHAGYQYSGKTAAAGYRRIGTAGKSYINPELIVIIGPSHYKSYRGCSTILVDYMETPLGKIRVNRKIAEKLLSDKLFKNDPSAFDREHSIEIQLPFLQRIFGDKMSGSIQILPILAGELDDNEARLVAGKITSVISIKRSFIIVSSDFTHYGPYFGYLPFKHTGRSTPGKIKKLDSGAIDHILKKDNKGFSDYINKTGITICGRNAIRLILSLPVRDFKAQSVYYDTSGNITGDYTNSVSYASILACGTLTGVKESPVNEGILTIEEKKVLLKSARDNISSWLTKGTGIKVPENIPAGCKLKRGAFVTLKKHGELRGCIGYILSEKSLIQTVLDNSYNAAFRDSRFTPVRPEELKDISIEISVLTEPEPVRSIDEIKTGVHGLIVEKGRHRGLLLPQVVTEQGWDLETFLSHTCLKAGLPEDSWKDRSTKIYRFEAIVFSEDNIK